MKARGHAPPLDAGTASAFFASHVPEEWFAGPLEVSLDDMEILVVGRLVRDGPAGEAVADTQECIGTIEAFRESSRGRRIEIAAEAERAYGRKVAWGARCGDVGLLFTHLSVPAMTRLRLSQRLVLDTLVESGVAKSRSDALAWCVRMVERNLDEWLDELRSALSHVEDVRRRGPG